MELMSLIQLHVRQKDSMFGGSHSISAERIKKGKTKIVHI